MDEAQLWERFKKHGDIEARNELIVEYMRVVKYVAGRMAIHVPQTVDINDLINWGVLGLMDAVEKFDHAQNVKFSTYATIRIRGAILDQIRSLDWAPRSLRAMARKIGNAREQLRHEQGSEPDSDDIAQAIGVTTDEVETCVAQVQTAQVLSLDDYLSPNEGEQARRLDLLPDSSGRNPMTEAELVERQERVAQEILGLPEQQQKVLYLYYYEELTLKEIGAVLEVSESRICQVHGAALKKLRNAVRPEP